LALENRLVNVGVKISVARELLESFTWRQMFTFHDGNRLRGRRLCVGLVPIDLVAALSENRDDNATLSEQRVIFGQHLNNIVHLESDTVQTGFINGRRRLFLGFRLCGRGRLGCDYERQKDGTRQLVKKRLARNQVQGSQ